MFKVIFILFILMFISCTKKKTNEEVNYTEEEFTKVTSELNAVNPVGDNSIPFSEYSANVNKVTSKTFVYKRLRFYAIGFNSVIEAKNEAKRLNQYYSHNFLFDQVEGEPILEDMVIEVFGAKNPNRLVQKIPKKSEGHEEGEAEAHDKLDTTHHEAAHH